MAVELLNGSFKLGALLPLNKKLGDLLATLDVLRTDLPYLAFICSTLSFQMKRAEGVVGELALMLGLRDLGLAVPELTLFVRHVLPSDADDLRERAVIRLNLGRNMLTFDEGRAEEDKRVRRTGNMVVCLLLAVAWSARGGDADGGGK